MKVLVVPVTPFVQNCSIIICEQTNRAAIVDPGGDIERIDAAVRKEGVEVEKILLTHGHLDHASAAGSLAKRYGVPVEGPHREDLFLIEQLPGQAAMYGFGEVDAFVPDRWLENGDTVSVGQLEIEVYHCPGHTPGHVVLFHRPSRFAVVGDVLFQGSIGRTDFPRGDHEALIASIRGRLWPLGNDVQFLPGHGPTSTFGEERRSNPFVADGV
ncbi:MAG: MBL fold metallo-hydrolase [Gammaproteobacteria bacterium]